MTEDKELIGTCDTCGTEYETYSTAGRCGDCGMCSAHCEHSLPNTINVSYMVSYSVDEIIKHLTDETGVRPDIYQVLQQAEKWAVVDFAQPIQVQDLYFQNELGDEL